MMVFVVDGDKPSLLVPSQGLEPVTARGRFFRLAEAKGLLSFKRPEDATYFFNRYEGEMYDNVKDDALAVRFLTTPPWMSAAP